MSEQLNRLLAGGGGGGGGSSSGNAAAGSGSSQQQGAADPGAAPSSAVSLGQPVTGGAGGGALDRLLANHSGRAAAPAPGSSSGGTAATAARPGLAPGAAAVQGNLQADRSQAVLQARNAIAAMQALRTKVSQIDQILAKSISPEHRTQLTAARQAYLQRMQAITAGMKVAPSAAAGMRAGLQPAPRVSSQQPQPATVVQPQNPVVRPPGPHAGTGGGGDAVLRTLITQPEATNPADIARLIESLLRHMAPEKRGQFELLLRRYRAGEIPDASFLDIGKQIMDKLRHTVMPGAAPAIVRPQPAANPLAMAPGTHAGPATAAAAAAAANPSALPASAPMPPPQQQQPQIHVPGSASVSAPSASATAPPATTSAPPSTSTGAGRGRGRSRNTGGRGAGKGRATAAAAEGAAVGAVLPDAVAPSQSKASATSAAAASNKAGGAAGDKRVSAKELNDVTSTAGVNVEREAESMALHLDPASAMPRGSVPREPPFLSHARLLECVTVAVHQHGLKTFRPECLELISLAAQERQRALVESLVRVARARSSSVRDRFRVSSTGDVRKRLRQIEAQDKLDAEERLAAEQEAYLENAKIFDAQLKKLEGKTDPESVAMRERLRNLRDADESKRQTQGMNSTAAVAVGGRARKRRRTSAATSKAAGISQLEKLEQLMPNGFRAGSFLPPSTISHATGEKTARVSLKDLLLALEREPQMSKTAFLYTAMLGAGAGSLSSTT